MKPRIKGIIIVSILIASLLVFRYIFLEPLVERTIESIGQSIVKAKVDVRGLQLNLITGSTGIKYLEVADPDDPWKNLFEARNISFRLSPRYLTFGKFVIDEIQMLDIKCGTKRSASGALPPKPQKKKKREKKPKEKSSGIELATGKLKDETKALPVWEIPRQVKEKANVEAIIAGAQLSSVDYVEELEEKYKEPDKIWRDILKQDELQSRTDKILSDIDSLKSAKVKSPQDVKNALAKADIINKSVDLVKNEIHSRGDSVASAFSGAKGDIAKIDDIAKGDFNVLKKQLSVERLDTSRLAESLVGRTWMERVDKLLGTIRVVRRFLPSGKKKKPEKPKRLQGVNVEFPRPGMPPAFVIRKINLSGESSDASFSGVVTGISSNARQYGKPLEADIAMQPHKARISRASFSALIDHTGDIEEEKFKLSGDGVSLAGMKLGSPDSIQLTGTNGTADIALALSAIGNELLLKLQVVTSNFSLKPQASGDITPLINTLFARPLGKITITAESAFHNDAWKTKITSNLGKVLSTRLKQAMSAAIAEQEARLRKEINNQIASRRAALTDKIEQAKQRGQERMDAYKNKIGKYRKELEEERAKLEDQLKARVEQETGKIKKEAEEKLEKETDKLKERALDKLRRFK